ncbi:rab effector Noc2 [Microplitis demolitor]|uniref:rab effector Noc2 n=1 Tax=Microplitis demolitor TaxID=69319 RepID=UPI00043FFE88|nr:rab effector Noc2 [Microplitis demolitor]
MESQYLSNNLRSKNTKWVCPSDRQLALRGKLKTGWSVKSVILDGGYNDHTLHSSYSRSLSSLNNVSQNSTALTSEEQKRIIEVIKRAEVLDLSEQERVGKLVERLDNMKRNVSIVAARSNNKSCGNRCIRDNQCVCSCALCSEKFSVLGAGSVLCRDCCKYVCKKCGVETTTISALVLTNESRMKYKKPIAASSTPNISLAKSFNDDEPMKISTKIFLCRICTETREMWKKSGAWFFKSLPKYILPEKKKIKKEPENVNSGLSTSSEPLEQDSSSDDDVTPISIKTHSFLSRSLSSSLTGFPQKQNVDNKAEVEIEHDTETVTEINDMKSNPNK